MEWIGREGLAKETHGEYLQQFCTDFYKGMTKLIDRAMRKEDSSAQGQIITEILQHLHACKNSVTVREDALERELEAWVIDRCFIILGSYVNVHM